MARHIVLRTTPRVDERIAALDFSIEKQLPPIVDGMPRIKYQWSSNHEETVAEAVKSRVRERDIISIRTSLIQIAKNAEIRMNVEDFLSKVENFRLKVCHYRLSIKNFQTRTIYQSE